MKFSTLPENAASVPRDYCGHPFQTFGYTDGSSRVAGERVALTVADLPTLAFLSSLADTLAAGTVDLPAFPEVVIKVQEAFKDPDYTPQKVARVISTERKIGRAHV